MTKMKGLFKGIKFISQMFVYKEHEMEIGYPTDVKHVAHFGWDDAASGKSPSWMNNFKDGSEFSANTLSSFGQQMEIPPFEGKQKGTPWDPKDVDRERDIRFRPGSALFADTIPPCSEKPKIPKKIKRKKIKASSPAVPSVSPR